MVAKPRLNNFLGGAILSLISVALCLIVAELFFTFLYKQRQAHLEQEKAGDILCTHRSKFLELIYTRIPNRCGANSHGYRDYEYPYKKEPGLSRVVVIGDSVADAYGIDLGAGFGKLLESALNQSRAEEINRVEVIILAQAGYSTSQELFLLENEAFKYSPDLILWSYVLNDPAHPVYRSASGQVGDYFYRPAFHSLHFVMGSVFKLTEKLHAIGCDKEYHALLHCAHWKQVQKNIARIAAIAATQAVPVIFLIHPLIPETGDYSSYPLVSLHEKLAREAHGAGLQVLDLLDTFSAYDPAKLTIPSAVWFDIWHPNETGHRITAEAILAKIAQDPNLVKRLAK